MPHRAVARSASRGRAAPPARRLNLVARAVMLILVAAALSGVGFAQSWELRVCAEPANLPFSNAAGEGFENRIAQLLARELDARLSYEWLPSPSSRYRDLYLHNGRCDAVMGVSDGHEGFLTTIAYYRSSYVFVTREDAPFEVESLDDPDLEELTIAVAGGGRTGPGRLALSARGLGDNLIIFGDDRGGERSGSSGATGPVEAVMRGEADVAVVWGPVAGFAAAREEANLQLRPVTPQIDRAFLPMVIPIAIGVRPDDEALRDTLNRALTRVWNEIEAVLESHGVPLAELPVPSAGQSPEPRDQQSAGLAVGVVLPLAHGSATGSAEGVGDAAEAARRGVLLAEEELMRAATDASAPPVRVFLASASGAEALQRAARRLIATNGVDALVGGFGEEQARALAGVAGEHGVLFLNIGASADSLRGAELPGSFHVEASDSMYLRALLSASEDVQPAQSWFLVRDASDRGRALERAARRLLSRQDARVAGTGVFREVGDQKRLLDRIESADPERVLVLMEGRAQLEFLGLYDAFAMEPGLTILPEPMTQTHGFQLALQEAMSQVDSVRVASLWEEGAGAKGAAGVSGSGSTAEELNDSYLARWGVPMEASAWAGYQAVSILRQASELAEVAEAARLRAVMSGADAAFAVDKGVPLRFDSNGQLQQPVYVIRIERTARELANVGVVVGEHFPDVSAPRVP